MINYNKKNKRWEVVQLDERGRPIRNSKSGNIKKWLYSESRYGKLACDIAKMSENENKRIYNYYEVMKEGHIKVIIPRRHKNGEMTYLEILMDKKDFEKISENYILGYVKITDNNISVHAIEHVSGKRKSIRGLIAGITDTMLTCKNNKLDFRKNNITYFKAFDTLIPKGYHYDSSQDTVGKKGCRLKRSKFKDEKTFVEFAKQIWKFYDNNKIDSIDIYKSNFIIKNFKGLIYLSTSIFIKKDKKYCYFEVRDELNKNIKRFSDYNKDTKDALFEAIRFRDKLFKEKGIPVLEIPFNNYGIEE